MRSHPRGFTFFELGLVLVVAIILYSFSPILIAQIQGSQFSRAAVDARVLAGGLWGAGEDSNGVIGDMGLKEANPTLINVANDVTPASPGATYATSSTFDGMTGGWWGPYIGYNGKSNVTDPWGNPWRVDNDGKIRSYGPDGIANNADDLVSPRVGPMALGQTGSLYIQVVDTSGEQIPGISPQTIDYVPGGEVIGSTPPSTTSTTPNMVVFVTNPNASSTPPGQLTNWQATWTQAVNAFAISGLWPGRHAIEVDGLQGGNCSGRAFKRTPQPSSYVNDCSNLHGHSIAYVLGGGFTTVIVQLK